MKKNSKKDLITHKTILEAVNEIFRKAFASRDDVETSRACLAVVEKMTGSEFGWIGELNKNRCMDTIAVSSPGWNVCDMPPEEGIGLLKNMPLRSYWGQVLMDEKPVIVNDPDNHPQAMGLPPGHPPITCFLGVPIFHQEKCFGMIGLANKQNGYLAEDKTMVEAASMVISEAIVKVRADMALENAVKNVTRFNAELKKKNAELDEFAFIVSHDLQAPLRKIISFAKLLHKDLNENSSNKIESDIHYITQSANQMEILIGDLLALARAGRSAMEWKQISLSDCVDRANEALSVIIKEKSAEIQKCPLPDVEADPTLITLLYQNLIGNALKFCGDHPPKIRLTADRKEMELILGVKDNGIGIGQQYLQLIFMPFKRYHTHNEYGGTGVGLSICRKIVERHNGRIWVESEVGKGSHFKFTLGAKDGASDA